MSDDQPEKWRENTPLEPLIGIPEEEQPYIGPPPSGAPVDPSDAAPVQYEYGWPVSDPAPYGAPPAVPGYGDYGGYGYAPPPPVLPPYVTSTGYAAPFQMTRPHVDHPLLLAKSVAVGLVTIIGLSLLMHFATPRNPFDDGYQPGVVGQVVHLP